MYKILHMQPNTIPPLLEKIHQNPSYSEKICFHTLRGGFPVPVCPKRNSQKKAEGTFAEKESSFIHHTNVEVKQSYPLALEHPKNKGYKSRSGQVVQRNVEILEDLDRQRLKPHCSQNSQPFMHMQRSTMGKSDWSGDDNLAYVECFMLFMS